MKREKGNRTLCLVQRECCWESWSFFPVSVTVRIAWPPYCTVLSTFTHCLFWRVSFSLTQLFTSIREKISGCIVCWLCRMFGLSLPSAWFAVFLAPYGFIARIHCRGLCVFSFLVFLVDSMSLWSSRTGRSFSPTYFCYGCNGPGTFGTVGGLGWVLQATFPIGTPDNGKEKRDKVKFDSVAYFFLYSQRPVRSQTWASRLVYS